jgi:hypothetical protein
MSLPAPHASRFRHGGLGVGEFSQGGPATNHGGDVLGVS